MGVAVPAQDSVGLTLREDLAGYLEVLGSKATASARPEGLSAPMENQEVWAAGVTYLRSRAARMAEAETSGGGDFYDRVYSAERPEIFFKSTPHRVVGAGAAVRIRRDSHWNVPEPELALVISPGGSIIGYTVGNDMSSRDIEGANPLYLPQAKTYDKACALGPAILVSRKQPQPETRIQLRILRAGTAVFEGATRLSEMKRKLTELVSYLYRESSFPNGAILLTGTGVVPGDDFTLEVDDRVEITIDGIGTLANTVERAQ